MIHPTVAFQYLNHSENFIVHSDLDSVLFTQGDHVTIQNVNFFDSISVGKNTKANSSFPGHYLTWNESQGFAEPVTAPLLVNGKKGGIWHSERSLTFVEIYNSGHMVPEYAPCLSLALFTALTTNGSIGNGQLSAACRFTETFPVPWPAK